MGNIIRNQTKKNKKLEGLRGKVGNQTKNQRDLRRFRGYEG